MRKRMLEKYAVALLIVLMFSPVFSVFSPTAQAYLVNADGSTDPIDWYRTINGVLTSDSYPFYPYEEKSLDIGFSKFGELISIDVTDGDGVGLQYPGYESVSTYDQENTPPSADPFAHEAIDRKRWLNGWLIDIKYTEVGGSPREIWAMALFADGDGWGKDWITMPPVLEFDQARPLWQEHAPYANPDADKYVAGVLDPIADYRGGRKTNGICVTDPIIDLYDGPRKYIGVTNTLIMDTDGTELVNVTITIIFNKVEKSVILLKDIKALYDKDFLNVQFGNREEWDLDTIGYVHFYTDEPVQEWWNFTTTVEVMPVHPDDYEWVEIPGAFEHFKEFMIENKYPKKWWQDVYYEDWPVGDEDGDGDIDDEDYYIWRMEHQGWFETQSTCLTDEWHIDDEIKEHGYAVAQIIDSDLNYVGAHAVWPHPEFWSVQNYIDVEYEGEPIHVPLMLAPISRMLEWNKWTVRGDIDEELNDMPDVWIKIDDHEDEATYPTTPWIIYEHDFRVRKNVIDQYRIVSVFTLTDYHDADDADADDLNDNGIRENLIDREIRYQLDEIFNPWDLRKAMNKKTKRWVEYFYDEDFMLDLPIDDPDTGYRLIELKKWEYTEYGVNVTTLPVIPVARWWDKYCVPSERVELDLDGDCDFDYVLTPGDVLNIPSTKPDPLNMWKSKPYFYYINRMSGFINIFKTEVVGGVTQIDWDWELPEDAKIKVLWSSPHIATVGEQWFWDCVEDNDFRLSLHHNIPWYFSLLGLEEVFDVPSEEYTGLPPGGRLMYHGTYVAQEEIKDAAAVNAAIDGDTTIFLDKFVNGLALMLGKMLQFPTVDGFWLYIERGDVVLPTGSDDTAIHSSKAEDHFESEFNIGSLPWMDIYIGGVNETLVNVTTCPDPPYEVGDVLEGPHGPQVVIAVIGPYGGFWQVETVYPMIRLEKGEYIIHETWECDELVLNTALYVDSVSASAGGLPTLREYIADLPEVQAYLSEMKATAGIEETEADEVEAEGLPLDLIPHMMPEVKIVYKVWSGRYEWTVVGRDAASVDAIGSALVTAAFKNKKIEIGISGLDMNETLIANRIPYVMSKLGAGDTFEAYRDNDSDPGKRAYLIDDWCASGQGTGITVGWPVSSSNMIFIGGAEPYVNLGAYYFNDFIEALSDFTGEFTDPHMSPWAGKIVGTTCWNKTTYSSDEDVGYAVIGTHKDKNGTVGLSIYGHWGRDTYYACRWFDYYKFKLQHINPCVTAIILEIDYDDPQHPTFKVVEQLGTISEKPVHPDP